jgi:acyl carrier protein
VTDVVYAASVIEEEIYNAIRKVKPSLASIPLDSSTRFDSLGLESLERAIVVFELEDFYEVSIVDADLDDFRTVGEARDTIAKLLAGKSARSSPGSAP